MSTFLNANTFLKTRFKKLELLLLTVEVIAIFKVLSKDTDKTITHDYCKVIHFSI